MDLVPLVEKKTTDLNLEDEAAGRATRMPRQPDHPPQVWLQTAPWRMKKDDDAADLHDLVVILIVVICYGFHTLNQFSVLQMHRTDVAFLYLYG